MGARHEEVLIRSFPMSSEDKELLWYYIIRLRAGLMGPPPPYTIEDALRKLKVTYIAETE
jgi:hypothetical protein